MWKYLPSANIDREKWDACVQGANNNLIYGYSWYLDIAAPGWEGLVWKDYQNVFPVPVRKKWGLKYLYQPNFIQRLEAFGQTGGHPSLSDLRALPSDIVSIDLTTGFALENTSRAMANVILDLKPSSDDLMRGFSSNTRRNYKKAQNKNLQYTEVSLDHLSEMISIFQKSKPHLLKSLPKDFFVDLQRLVHELAKRNRLGLIGCWDDKKLVAGAVIAKAPARHTLLFTAADEAARKSGAMHFLLGHYILQEAGSDLLFDFEGSTNPGVARFYLSFGGQTETYYHTRRRRLFNRSL
ncbi:GNAT family N-acetyltransferase [bacterium SCSIO 12741]|nr:GNAT family N-acetyltransferase [bacterium SCSIO 12741]